MRAIFCFLLFVLALGSCSQESKNDVASEQISAITMSDIPEAKSTNSFNIPQKIIKNASLRFETNDLEDTFAQIKSAIKANKGTVQNDSEGKDQNSIYRNISIRVPSQNFDAFIESISKGVSYFERKDISSENVTDQYIDITTRLKTKRKLEERYLQILQKATKIREILEIEKQISIIREEIESKEGQLKYLESRVAESTITIEFYKPVAEKEGVKTSYGSKIITAIKTGFFELSGFLISIISIWPIIILVGVIAYFIRKRFKRKKI